MRVKYREWSDNHENRTSLRWIRQEIMALIQRYEIEAFSESTGGP